MDIQNMADSLASGDNKALYAASALQASRLYFYIARMQHFRAEVRQGDWERVSEGVNGSEFERRGEWK